MGREDITGSSMSRSKITDEDERLWLLCQTRAHMRVRGRRLAREGFWVMMVDDRCQKSGGIMAVVVDMKEVLWYLGTRGKTQPLVM